MQPPKNVSAFLTSRSQWAGKPEARTEKMPYALTDADLALCWNQRRVGAALCGPAGAQDMRLSGHGILARERDVAPGPADLRRTPLRMTATYDGAQLGQFTKLVYGATKAWREP